MILTHDGVTQPVEEWALDYGITPELIEHRMAHGWITAAAIETPMDAPKGYRLPETHADSASERHGGRGRKPAIFIEHNGRCLSVREWASLTGLRSDIILARRRRGLTPKDILAPSQGRGGYRHGRRAGGGKQLSSNSRETGAPVTRKIASK